MNFRLKLTGEQIDDRVVEVFWETEMKQWRFMRFRDDKPNGNHKSVVNNIIQSIIDGVEKDDVGDLYFVRAWVDLLIFFKWFH